MWGNHRGEYRPGCRNYIPDTKFRRNLKTGFLGVLPFPPILTELTLPEQLPVLKAKLLGSPWQLTHSFGQSRLASNQGLPAVFP